VYLAKPSKRERLNRRGCPVPRRAKIISDEEIERWQLAREARTLASKESIGMPNHYLNVATRWEALIEEIEAQRRAKGIVR
jgi:hypothetical protein